MKFYEMESIKKILGLPSQAGAKQIEARIGELLSKEEELEVLKGQEQATSKSKGQPGVWVGLGIIILILFSFIFFRK